MSELSDIHWYVVYTKPRWEKKVNLLLTEKQITAYCPLNKVRKKWSDRYKVVEEPLFKGYVFVQIQESEKIKVLQTSGILNFVHWLGKPAKVQQKEIDKIKAFLDEFTDVSVEESFEPLQQVEITQGPFMDYKGMVLQVKGSQVKIQIMGMGMSLVAQFPAAKLKLIKP